MAESPGTSGPRPEPPTPKPTAAGEEIEQAKSTVWLAYLGILFLIPLLTLKENAFAKFHVKQGIILTILGVAIWVVAWIPFIGWLLGFVVWIYILVMIIMGIVNSLGGKYWKMPILGGLAQSWFKF
jgi:uncharacterized membrane protein